MEETMRCFSTVILVGILLVSCASPKGNSAREKTVEDAQKKQAHPIPSQIYAGLLPTLKVGVDSCYVFLQPDDEAPFFGPLLSGENVKRLDVRGGWIRVWVQRLRVSGWVRDHMVLSVNPKHPENWFVPSEFLAKVNVIKTDVNVRKGPSLLAAIISRVSQGHEFLILDEENGWYQIWLSKAGKKGWIYGKMVVKQRQK